MKKSLIALAALAATSAFAQSSVTLYGIVEATTDIGYSRVVDTVTTNNSTGALVSSTRAETKNSFRVQDGSDQGTGSSRVGFRGTEDLGGGLKANFQLEMGLRIDDGCTTLTSTGGCANGGGSANSGGSTFGRNAWGGVSGGFGEVRVGRQVLGSFAVQGNSWSAGASNGLYDAASANLPMGGVRFSNAIKYISPRISGFSGNVTVSAPETNAVTSNANLATGVTSTAKRRAGVDAALEFANGPVYVGLGYNLRDADNNTNTGAGASLDAGKITAYTVGGSYDLGVVKPYVNYTRQNTKSGALAVGNIVTNGDETGRAWSVGLRAPVGAITVIAGVGRLTTSGVTSATGFSNGSTEARRNSYQIGAQYALSKRSLVEANYGQARLESTSVSNVLAAAQNRTRVNDKTSAFNVGLKHSF